MATLSVVINVFNEGHLLQECLESIKWADEIVITDMHSTDDSVAVYSRYTDKAVLIDWDPIADRVHHIGFAMATSDWVLKLDPDERVSPSLATQIRELIASPAAPAAYVLPFKSYFFGEWIRHTGFQYDLENGYIRLFRRTQATWPTEVHTQPKITGEIGAVRYDEALDNAVDHISCVSIAQFMEKANRYTAAEVEKRLAAGKSFKVRMLFVLPLAALRRRYLIGKGYKDGMHGVVLAILMAVYAELIAIKMWETTLTDRDK